MDETFQKRILTLYGQKGKEWLQTLPGLIHHYEQEWNIQTGEAYPLSYNYVCKAKTTLRENAVLKVSYPEDEEFSKELLALKRFPKNSVVRILKVDVKNGVILLEQAIPGHSVKSISPDQDQINIVSKVIKQLHLPANANDYSVFPTIYQWAEALERYKNLYSVNTGPIPKKLFEKAAAIFAASAQEKSQPYILHGDLHNDNILLSARGWLVIDPKGVIGEREFELGAYLRNPLTDISKGSNYKTTEANRIAQFSEMIGFEKIKLKNWAFACAILSIAWFLEDEGKFHDIYLENALLIDSLRF